MEERAEEIEQDFLTWNRVVVVVLFVGHSRFSLSNKDGEKLLFYF